MYLYLECGGVKQKCAFVMLLLLLFMTLGTTCFIRLAFAEGVVHVVDIRLYWDEKCTNPVSSVDFGITERGQSKYVTFWLKDASTDEGRISCCSANFNPSSKGIAECWERKVGRYTYISNWNKKMKTGDLWEVRYTIKVAQDIQMGVYSWDLRVCYITFSSILALSISCILTVTQ